MAKKENKTENKTEKEDQTQESALEKQKAIEAEMEKKLPKEIQEKLKAIKTKLEKLQKRVVEKFDKYIMGMALLPPEKHDPKSGEKAPEEKIKVLILVDDSDSKKMTKEELKAKLSAIIESIAKEIDEKIEVQTIILTEVWQSLYDGKTEMTQMIALSAPLYDTGMLAAIKISEVHKSMVLKKFEKYIVAYVLAGSLVQGRATKTSDIDVFVVIDDTDVKKMTRAELKDKLRAIIIGMGYEAGKMTGVENKINIQVYILTDFWDMMREANPIAFTFLRDGIPFYDRGIFMPWKQLLRMGKIKPSAESIEMFMSTGDQMLKRVQFKINEIGMEDTYYALLTPSQAALMMYGIPPPAPKETPEIMRDVFVKKEKLLEEKYVKILENVIKLRKDLEHGTKKEISGKDVDKLLADAQDYLKRIKKLFEEIETRKRQEDILNVYETIITVVRDVLKLEGCEKCTEDDIVKEFEQQLIVPGKMPLKYLRVLKDMIKAKKDFDSGKLSKNDIEKIKKDGSAFVKVLVEHLQRKRGREIERAKIRFKYGETFGEIVMMEKFAFITTDLDAETKEIQRAKIMEDGSLKDIQKSSLEELEKALAAAEFPKRVFIKQPVFDNLKELFGKDVEILIGY
ncbi:MAG: nucleotidyltransferase domain-containing protein [Nanoarchaeota archaeon]|nr:nucleotidyltransferase domain-containing protein [Nanoarchaeota archaeon]